MRTRLGLLLCLLLAAATLFVLGCERKAVEPPAAEIPEVYAISLLTNPDNVLSFFLSCKMGKAVSVSVDVLRDSVLAFTTPSYRVESDSIAIPIVGLRPHTRYELRMKLTSSSGGVRLHSSTLTTQPLSSDIAIPPFSLISADSPSVRYVLLGITPAREGKSYAVMVDRDAVPVWYKEFRDAVTDVQKHANGRYTAWSSTDGSPSNFHEFDVMGRITGGYRASNQLETGPHELRLVSGGYVLFGIESPGLTAALAIGDYVRDALARESLPAPRPVHTEVRRVRDVYPVYALGHEAAFAAVDAWARTLPRFVHFGRQGLFAHDNTHHALAMGWALADCLGPDGSLDRARWRAARGLFRSHVVED